MRFRGKQCQSISSFWATVVVCTGMLFVAPTAFGTCSNPQNSIEAENCLPGNPETDWQVTGSGDLSIQGFATDMSINAGQTISFKVNTDAHAYVVEIYRLGYYGGLGSRKVAVLSPSAQLPQVQPACIFDNATSLIDCGNWAVSAAWTAPPTALSGVYLAHLVRQDTGGDSLIPFVVRNDASTSAIVYQTSDLTWQAYNNYGGHSLYGDDTFNLANRAHKVSFNRPFNTHSFAADNFVFWSEYPMIRWLEANGYDVTYLSGIDVSRSGSLLLNHKVFMSSGHDEYWDTTQRSNVQAARDSGVNLTFFSGNEMFWKTRWESSVDGSNTPYRTLVCYKETLGDAVDPMDPPVWTGTWRDPTNSPPADGGRPENSLTGTLFKVNGPGDDNTDLSIQVPAADGKMRFWRNTTIAHLASNQIATLPPGTLGYEWDIAPTDQSRPAGLFHLSTATYNLTTDYLLDYGGVYGAGTATHNMTMYRAQSGALVFGSGTIQWSWGLDSDHDGDVNPAPDVDMQQATVNLFADLGVQPATIQSGLQLASPSSDTQAPVSTITSPAYAATVSTGSPITISGTATDAGGGVVAAVEVSVDGGQTWNAATGRTSWSYSWTPHAVGTVYLLSRAVDDSANLENPLTSGGNPSGGVQVNVNPQTCPCSIWNSSLAPSLIDSGDGSAVEVGLKFRTDNDGVITGVRFYKATNNLGTHVGHLWSSNGTLLATATFTGESSTGWQDVQFANPVPVTANTTYVVSYFAPNGHYSADSSYFRTSAYDNPPLHALMNGFDGSDGVYSYTTVPGVFPIQTFSSANYWVDIVFVSGSTFNISGTILGTGGAGATVNLSGPVSTSVTTDANGFYTFAGLVNGTYTVTPVNSGVTFTPANQTLTINGLSQSNVNFAAAATNPLSISGSITGASGPGTVISITGPASLSTVADTSGNYSFNGLIPGSYFVTPTQAGFIFTPETQVATLTNANVTGINFTAQPCPCSSIWSDSATPTLVDSGDGLSVEVGVRFRSDVAGHIQAIRFYKASTNTGTHIGHIWSNTGTLLGSQTFANESSAGWQEVVFTNPVPIAANTTYVAAYFAPAGHYSADSQSFQSSGVDNPPLHALANGVDGPNGVYAYAPTPVFPTTFYGPTNYWVDVVFLPAPPHNLSGTIMGPGGPGAFVTLVGGSTNTTMADASGNWSFTNISDGTYVVTASQPGYAFDVASQTVTLNGADLTGITISTLLTCMPCQSIWQGSSAPVMSDAGDPQSVNVGVKFRADSDGYIVGLRFYKSALNTGMHVGTLWTSNGTPLGSVTFSNEASFGWQQALFPSPISINANTTYVISYLAPQGHYAGTNDAFASSGVDSPPLHALASGVDGPNGVYAYGSTTLFPTLAYRSSNYWVDVMFSPGTTHTVSGTITGTGGPNATVNLTGSANATTTVDSAGNYSFTGLANGIYYITPSNSGYVFNPGVQAITINGADQNGINFATVQICPCNTIWQTSATPATIDSGDNVSVNVGVRFRADADGYIVGLRFYKAGLNTGTHVGALWSNNGTQLATAVFGEESQSGWQQVLFGTPVPVTANTTYVASYLAPAGHYSADLNIFATNNVDSPPLHALADGLDGPNGVFLYGATLAFPTQMYQAANYWVDVIYADPQTYSIEGTISGLGGAGATVSLTGNSSATTTADANGNFSFDQLANGSYTITPNEAGVTFSPTSQTVTVSSAHVSNVNFTSTGAQIYSISGTISGPGGAGATVTLTGASSATTTADGSGNYAFSGLTNGSYTVTPSNTGYSFTPASQSATVSGSNVIGLNFTTATQTYSISGTVGGPGGAGATVNLSGASTATTTADSSGNFSFSGLSNGSYTVTPSNPGFVFSPSSQTTTVSGANITGLNFAALPTVSSITINPAAVIGGNTSTGTVTLTAPAPAGGAVVTLLSSNTGAAQVPASITVAANATTAAFTVTTSPVTGNTALNISATYGSTQSAGFTVTAATLSSVSVNPASVVGGGTSTGTVTLNGPAPAGGALVTLSSSNPSAAQVPASVTVPANATTATFTATTSPVSANTSLTISATYGASQTTAFTVNQPIVSSVTLNPTSVPGGGTSTGTVTLTGPAPGGGAVVTLSSSNTSAAQVPASVTVPANAITAAFTITTSAVGSNTTVTISGTYGATQTASLTVITGSASSVTLNPISVVGGGSSTGTVTLAAAAPVGGAIVALSSSNTGLAQVPSSVTVAAGATSATFTVTTTPVSSNATVTISATYGVTRTATLTVTGAVLNTVTVTPNSVIGGTSSTGTVTLNGPAPAGGAVVTLTSGNTAAAQVPTTVTVAANATTATFTVTTNAVSSNTPVTITGVYGTTKNASLTVTAAVLSTVTFAPGTVTGGTSSTGTVTLNGPAPANGAVVNLSSNNTSAAQVPASVTVAANTKSATFTVTTNPVSANANVSITGVYGATKSGTLTVSAATVSAFSLNPVSVTGGNTSTATVTLSGPAPANGAVVTLSSNNTAIAQVPASVTVPANATTATFAVTSSPVSTTSLATISATYTTTRTANLTVFANIVNSVTMSPASVVGSTSSTGTVTLSRAAPAGGAVVTLSSNNTAATQVPASVTVPANVTTATFTATTTPVASNTPVSISATYGATKTATLTVTTPALSSLTLNPSSVVGSTSSTGTVTLNGPAPVGGAVVTLSSNNTAAAQVPASITVAANATTATFTITTGSVASNTSVTITATRGVAKTAILTVTAPVLSSLTLNPTTVKGPAPSTGTVTLNGPAPSSGTTVTLSSSNTGVATVPASVTVSAGNTTATFTVTSKTVTSTATVTITGTKGVTKTASLTVTP